MEEQDRRIEFLNEVWLSLQEEKDYNVIREFINKMVVLNDEYRFNGGVYPDVNYVLGLAKDEVNMIKKEMAQFEQLAKEEAERKKKSELEELAEREENIKKIKENFLKRFEKKA